MGKIFVGNIPHGSSEGELQQWVESQGFQVESAQIIRDRSTGQSRGFGFVMLNEEWKIKDAIAALNGQRINERFDHAGFQDCRASITRNPDGCREARFWPQVGRRRARQARD